MATVQLQWDIGDWESLISDGYDRLKVEVENPATVWTESTRKTTRIPIVENVETYIWELISEIGYNFRAVPIKSASLEEGTPIVITGKKVRGYCTVANMRSEGFSNTTIYPDTLLQSKIDYATSVIDRICGQRFDPFYSVQTVDMKHSYVEVHLDIPVIAVFKVENAFLGSTGGEYDMGDIVVYNRHLTQGLKNPDDRGNPMISFQDDVSAKGTRLFGSGKFDRGRRSIKIYGINGYTELSPGMIAGETDTDSQVPLEYGVTPPEITRACMILVSAYLPKISDGGIDKELNASRLTEERTRDQSIKISKNSTTEDQAFGMTGFQEVDTILMRYCSPMRIGGV